MEFYPDILDIQKQVLNKYNYTFIKVLKNGKLGGELWAATHYLLRSEIANQRTLLAQVINVEDRKALDHYDSLLADSRHDDEHYNNLGITHLRAARDSLRMFTKSERYLEYVKMDESWSKQRSNDIEQIKSIYINTIVASGIDIEDEKNITSEFYKALDFINFRGFSGFAEYIDGLFTQLIEIREREHRGRREHSLSEWKIPIIGILWIIPILATIISIRTGNTRNLGLIMTGFFGVIMFTVAIDCLCQFYSNIFRQIMAIILIEKKRCIG